MNRAKKLLMNTGIFAVANFGSKLLSFLLVPFYTWVLSTEQYGKIDIIVTTVSMIIPIITLGFSDAALRFVMDPEHDKRQIFSLSLFVVFAGNIFALFFAPLLVSLSSIGEYVFLLYVILFFNSMYSVCSQYSRGLGRVWQFALSGVIQTIVLIVSNLLFLLVYDLGINGYLYSLALSNAAAFIFVFFSAGLYRNITKVLNKRLFKLMVVYALPLIPNSFFWWAMNAADKYVIAMFLGTDANGIYAISNKIPTILNMVNVIFFQAWQLSAVEEVSSSNREKYYSDTFKYLSCLMIVALSVILVILRPLFSVWVHPEFYTAWKYTPPLLLGTLFMCFSSFWGTNFIALKKTGAIFRTTVYGFIVNFVLNIVLIPRLGLFAAAFSTAIGYFITCILRIIKSRRMMKIEINVPLIASSLVLIVLQGIALFLPYYLIWNVILCVLVILLNGKHLLVLLRKSAGLLHRRKQR